MIWKGGDVSSCCLEQNPRVLQQSWDNVALVLHIHACVWSSLWITALGNSHSCSCWTIHKQPNNQKSREFSAGLVVWVSCWMSSRMWGGCWGARCEWNEEQRRWEKCGSTGGSLKLARFFAEVGRGLWNGGGNLGKERMLSSSTKLSRPWLHEAG